MENVRLQFGGGAFGSECELNGAEWPLDALPTHTDRRGAALVASVAPSPSPLPSCGELHEVYELVSTDQLPYDASGPILSTEERDALLFALQEELAPVVCSTSYSTLASGTQFTQEMTGRFHVGGTIMSVSTPPPPQVCSYHTAILKKRRRKRPKDEVDSLRIEVKQLAARLERLRQQPKSGRQVPGKAQTQEESARGHQLRLLPAGGLLPHRPTTSLPFLMSRFTLSLPPPGTWELLAIIQREEAFEAMRENLRLRAQLESQHYLIHKLETMHHNRFGAQATQESPEYSIASWSLRNIDPAMHDDDFAIFTSLDLNLDALYAQTEHVLEDAGLTNFDGEFRYEMQLKCDEDGSFYMENLYSSVLPYDFLHIDRVLWYCKLTEELRARQHKSYKVYQSSNDIIWIKMVNTIQLSETQRTTFTVRYVLKRYIQNHRVIAVWEAVVDTEGAGSMRFNEKGWSLLRPIRVCLPNATGPLSIKQSCIRTTPVIQGSLLEKDLVAGTVAYLLIRSHRQFMQLMRQIANDLLVMQFDNLVL